MCDSQSGTDGPTDRQTDGLQELLEWPLATKNILFQLKGAAANLSRFLKVLLLNEWVTKSKKEGQFWNPHKISYLKLTLLAPFGCVLPKLQTVESW